MYTFDTTSTVTVTNGTKGIKLKRLGGVSIKRKNYTPASTKRAYKQYHKWHCYIIASNIVDIINELI